MNQFRKFYRKLFFLCLLFSACWLGFGVLETVAQTSKKVPSKTEASPKFKKGEMLYADIDPNNRRLFVVVSSGLWQYSLETKQWTFLSDLEPLPVDLYELEFAYDSQREVFLFWDRGAGRVYQMSATDFQLKRLDHTHNHRNQFKHQPFIKEGTVYAFGGYGYWSWKNYITSFSRELKEWTVQNVRSFSDLPTGRVPQTGVYISSTQEFFMYGGNVPDAKHRADDQYTSKRDVKDIWKYSFKNQTWKQLETIKELSFYESTSLRRIGRTNRATSSAYSEASMLWYIPMVSDDSAGDLVYLTPYDLQSGEVCKPILLPFVESDQMLPTNFFFNQQSESLIILGVKNLSSSDHFPLTVISVSEDTLLSSLQRPLNMADFSIYFLASFLLLGCVLLMYVYQRSKKSAESKLLPIKIADIQKLEWLKEDEKQLLNKLYKAEGFLESQELGGRVWPGIDNYDYRRKLRNDTINSINRKFLKRSDTTDKIIIRKKDPNDKRRYLYGLNSELVIFPN